MDVQIRAGRCPGLNLFKQVQQKKPGNCFQFPGYIYLFAGIARELGIALFFKINEVVENLRHIAIAHSGINSSLKAFRCRFSDQ